MLYKKGGEVISEYLMRSRLTFNKSARPNENEPNSERQPLIAVKRDNIKHDI